MTLKTFKRFSVAALAVASYGQELNLTGPPTARAGTQIDLALHLTNADTVAGIQWSLTPPVNFTLSPQVGVAAIAAEKTIECDDVKAKCLVVGMNRNAILPGQIAKFSIKIPNSVMKGTYPFVVEGLIAANANAIQIPIVAGDIYELQILARSDINGDGFTNWDDVRLMLDMIFGRTACTGDQNGDGKCDLIDVLLIIKDATETPIP